MVKLTVDLMLVRVILGVIYVLMAAVVAVMKNPQRLLTEAIESLPRIFLRHETVQFLVDYVWIVMRTIRQE